MSSKEKGAILEFSMIPLDKGEHFSEFVAGSIKIVKESGLPYKFGPMSTAIEGTFEECIEVVTKCFENMSDYSNRVSLNLKVDFKRGRENGLETKIKSVENKLKKMQ